MPAQASSRYGIYAAFAICLQLLVFLFLQSRGLEGGMDSWMHYLVSRYAFTYPELLLDQWNKPVFTWLSAPVCLGGIRALVWFNILCTGLAGLFTALSLEKNNPHAWLAVPFCILSPVLFGNTISGLTEPLNALLLSIVFWLWSAGHAKSSVSLASFLPFVRTEGFVICMALALFLIIKRQYRHLPFLITGSLVMNLAGFAITGAPFWIISENPYWKFEQQGVFDPGSGSILHFVRQGRAMFGLLPEMLLMAAVVFWLWDVYGKRKTDDMFLLALLVFLAYFGAHSSIYYLGILGSHGLTRVMAVVAPCVAIMCLSAINRLIDLTPKSPFRPVLYVLLLLPVWWSAYGENDYAKPYRFSNPTVKEDKALRNFTLAGEWIQANGLMDRVLVHQSPYFNVRFDKDPYNPQSSYYCWSIDQQNDWTPRGALVIWDGFSAVREGNLRLEWLRQNPAYREIHRIEGFEKPENNPDMYAIRIFEKIR